MLELVGGIMGLFVVVLGLLVLVACWLLGDVSVIAKTVLTVLYVASFGLMFAGRFAFLFLVAQCVLIGILGLAAFGMDFLSRRH
jgi:hypothetical protein